MKKVLCKSESKMFYRYITGKMKQKVGIGRFKVGDTVYEEDHSICEIMNKKFQEVFTRERICKSGNENKCYLYGRRKTGEGKCTG